MHIIALSVPEIAISEACNHRSIVRTELQRWESNGIAAFLKSLEF